MASSWIAAARMILMLTGGAVCLVSFNRPCSGQTTDTGAEVQTVPAFDTENFTLRRFIAVHGRQALIDGYSTGGLEVWAYPFQILSGYRVAFRNPGTTTALEGQDILSRVIYEPNVVTRIYLGPDFVVHEKLFIPLDHPGAILTYEISSSHSVEIEVHATPVLNLMWPGALGGQSTAWNPALSAFVLTEPADGYSAVVGSPQIVAHDEMDNRTVRDGSSASFGFTLQPDQAGNAQVYIALNPPRTVDPGVLFRQLVRDRIALEAAAIAHTGEVLRSQVKVETPDPGVNQAIAWSEIALDQAWVCNPDLGCGFVAGYGPSRGERRPQYNWFFAGDGLVATQAAIAVGDFEHARKELEFILRYQNRKTGMIWHELSQSAGLIDWAGKFPYMFVHVDISFQFLSAVERYVVASGDTGFLREHWKSIELAYEYCSSLIDPATGLPRIPSDKEGGDEQDRISDDLGLSTGWVQAASQFAHLAMLAERRDLAKQATEASRLAAAAIPGQYWNTEQNFWVSGHTPAGQNALERRSSPAEAISLELFSPEQNQALLDQLASSSFQTDWGARSVSSGSGGYDPSSYAKGSVWAMGTAPLAETFWSQHRPVSAMGMWQAMMPWTSLDSPGHMHEVLAGDVFRAQGESVPEQTWSSAGFLDATVHGLLGLDVDGLANRITFAPHLPADWRGISVENVHLSNASLGLVIERKSTGLVLRIDNPGQVFNLLFSPELPLGSQLAAASFRGQPTDAKLEQHPQETDARVVLTVVHGKSELNLEIQGGVSVIPEMAQPRLGEASSGVRVVRTSLADHVLTVEADVRSDRESRIQVKTEWGIAKVEGAELKTAGDGVFNLAIPANSEKSPSGYYRRVRVSVEFKP